VFLSNVQLYSHTLNWLARFTYTPVHFASVAEKKLEVQDALQVRKKVLVIVEFIGRQMVFFWTRLKCQKAG